jgi:hypothetical protein
MIPSLGRTVHYILPDTAKHKGQHRAARITQVWTEKQGGAADENTAVALSVDLDPANDDYNIWPILIVRHCTQDPYAKQLGSWHEPERTPVPEKTPVKRPEKELVPA